MPAVTAAATSEPNTRLRFVASFTAMTSPSTRSVPGGTAGSTGVDASVSTP